MPRFGVLRKQRKLKVPSPPRSTTRYFPPTIQHTPRTSFHRRLHNLWILRVSKHFPVNAKKMGFLKKLLKDKRDGNPKRIIPTPSTSSTASIQTSAGQRRHSGDQKTGSVDVIERTESSFSTVSDRTPSSNSQSRITDL